MGNIVIISSADLEWLSHNHPDLHYVTEKKQIIGELAFSMYYDKIHPDRYIINPSKDYAQENKQLITDVYEILIDFNSKTKIPDTFEIGCRIEASAKRWDIKNLLDLHVYGDKKLCLCIPLEWDIKMPNGFNLIDYFTNLLIPYFYYQSFFERYGKEPWKGYGHGDLGLLESFHRRVVSDTLSDEVVTIYIEAVNSSLETRLMDKRLFKGHHPCFCGSGRKIRNCHRQAHFGFNSLHKYYHMQNRQLGSTYGIKNR